MAAVMTGTEKIYYLKQLSPMLHFQFGDRNATLRATELKPKLDRFIEKWMARNKRNLPSDWRMKNSSETKLDPGGKEKKNTALNYRVRILNTEGNIVYEPKRDMPYFGNMGDNVEKKMCVTAKSLIELHIRCYIRELMDLIDECLPVFFLTVNFGTRQDKGFGSFVLCGDDGSPLHRRAENEKLLTDWYGKNKVYCIRYKRATSDQEILSDINTVYMLLKSGINIKPVYLKSYLMLFFADKSIDWEKKSLKQRGIAPVVYDKERDEPAPPGPEERYVRGLLGVGDQQQWFSDDGNHRKKITRKITRHNRDGKPVYQRETISINAQNRDIERVPSPLIFKIIENSVYILPGGIDSAVPGSWFTFENEAGNTVDLQIPSADEFDLDDIMSGFKDRINSQKVKTEFEKRWVEQRPVFIRQGCRMEVLGDRP